LAARPDLKVKPLRGNVDTRLRKLDDGEEGMVAIILASAGLERLALEHRISCQFDAEAMVPAVGQGALAIEAKSDNANVLAVLRTLDHEATRYATLAERAFLRRVEGSCQVPVGAYAQVDGKVLTMRAFVGDPDGSSIVCSKVEGAATDYVTLGEKVAEEVLEAGGRAILRDLLR
jgi:hydroxymethylbilane synthase